MSGKPPPSDEQDPDDGEVPADTPPSSEEQPQGEPSEAEDAGDEAGDETPEAEDVEETQQDEASEAEGAEDAADAAPATPEEPTVFQPAEPQDPPGRDEADDEVPNPVVPEPTVFVPFSGNSDDYGDGAPEDGEAEEGQPEEQETPDRTVFVSSQPEGAATADEADKTQFAGSAGVPKTELAGTSLPPASPVTTPSRQIRPGHVLNHIYEVKRLIARGGMGEVFEGLNINMDERVAIKVILPSLAADPDVVGMFRKEARTLTDLSHEALVSYRVMAQEPELGVLYIVTDYIDGVSLADQLARIDASTEDILEFATRLASGLRVAHSRGVIHRDLSPDNILLPDGKLQQAKLIDFGIAKDLDPGSQTIVGDGFAGKLGYVAPEQLGDFDRMIGPWTDVYSLGLCLLALVRKRSASMGATLVEAVDMRRAGANLDGIEPRLQGLLGWMLQADPRARPQSMEQLLDAIRSARLDRVAFDDTEQQSDSLEYESPGGYGTGSRKIAFGVAGGIALLLAGSVAWLQLGPDGEAEADGPAAVVQQPSGLPVVDQARRVVNTALPSVSCTWLSIVDVAQENDALTIHFTGVAGNPATAQADIARSLSASGIKSANLDFEEVAPITQGGCSALDTYRQIRDPFGEHLTVAQRQFEMRMQPKGSVYAGKLAANAILKLDTDIGDKDFALVGLDNSGLFTVLVSDKAEFERIYREKLALIELTGPQKYRMTIDLDHEGWSGMLLVTGKGPFPDKVIAPPIGGRGPSWQSEFMKAAGRNDWHTEMVWFKSVR